MNESVITTVAILFLLVIVGGIFLIIAKRVLRLALKFAFAMALVFMLVAGGAVGWWQGWFSSSSSSARRPAVQTNQRSNTNRRPSSR
ncbi:MAG TPA: hypothetical protein VFX97_00875 [Pyrinomonadaceae bacterium]|nr:hypothetical protein [Pyrinomonadaceae bacterium]